MRVFGDVRTSSTTRAALSCSEPAAPAEPDDVGRERRHEHLRSTRSFSGAVKYSAMPAAAATAPTANVIVPHVPAMSLAWFARFVCFVTSVQPDRVVSIIGGWPGSCLTHSL